MRYNVAHVSTFLPVKSELPFMRRAKNFRMAPWPVHHGLTVRPVCRHRPAVPRTNRSSATQPAARTYPFLPPRSSTCVNTEAASILISFAVGFAPPSTRAAMVATRAEVFSFLATERSFYEVIDPARRRRQMRRRRLQQELRSTAN